jgi:predicted alpha/beta superfamily hydrolase
LIIWLALPLVIVGGLWFSIDRSRGKPDPRLDAIQRAQLPGQDAKTGRSTEQLQREIAETEARKRSQGADSTDEAPATSQSAAPRADHATPHLSVGAVQPGLARSRVGESVESPSPSEVPAEEVKVSAGRIERVSVKGGGMPGAENYARDLLVWLPPGYDSPENKDRTYPVLYMQDGQDLFSPRPNVAAPGEWQVDETASRLISEHKVEPLIIVGVSHSGETRTGEYITLPLYEGIPVHGYEYIEFLAASVKPAVDGKYRTRPGPENTGVGGASLGAMIATEAALQHREVFGKVICESPPLTERNRALFNRYARQREWPLRVSIVVGGKEMGTGPDKAAPNRDRVSAAFAMRELLRGYGLGDGRLRIDVDPDGARDIPTWSRRFGAALAWLFPAKESDQTPPPSPKS